MKRLISIVAMVMVMFWCGSAMAQDAPQMYQMMPDDFGIYPPAGLDCVDTVSIPGFCFNPNFLPVARLFRAPDGSLNMQGNGEEIASIDFATDWWGNAVSPHRDYQISSFVKYEDPALGTMVPHCNWMYQNDSGTYSLFCQETRPVGYENTSLYCENSPYWANFTNEDGTIIETVEVPFSVCDEAGIFYVPAYPTPPPPPPSEMTLKVGVDMYIDDMFDVRSYDLSHPEFGLVNSVGGWNVGVSIFNLEKLASVGRVEITSFGGSTDGQVTSMVTPDVYGFLGDTLNSYDLWIGNRGLVAPKYEIKIYDLNGMIIPIENENGEPGNSWFVYPETNFSVVPMSQLRKMAIMKDGQIRVKFTAPYDERADQIRIRIMDDTGFIAQFKYLPDADGHYKIVQKDGDVIMDKLKVFIPAEYAGLNARIEYRVLDDTTHPDHLGWKYMSRGVTFFQLPAPEPVVVEEPEVTIQVECDNFNGVAATVVDGVCTCPDGYIYFEGIGCQ